MDNYENLRFTLVEQLLGQRCTRGGSTFSDAGETNSSPDAKEFRAGQESYRIWGSFLFKVLYHSAI